MSTRGVCGDGGGVGESTRFSVGGRTGVGGARERQSLGRHWRRRRRRDVMIKERATAGAVSATGRRIVPHLVRRWSVWRPSVWRRSECAGGVRDIVWRRRRRDTENEICGKKLSSRLRGSRPLVPDGGRRRQPSAFKYTLYLSQSHTYTHPYSYSFPLVYDFPLPFLHPRHLSPGPHILGTRGAAVDPAQRKLIVRRAKRPKTSAMVCWRWVAGVRLGF